MEQFYRPGKITSQDISTLRQNQGFENYNLSTSDNDVFSMAMINLPTMPSLASIFIYLQDLDSFQSLLPEIRIFLKTQATTSKKKIFLTTLVVKWAETNSKEYSHIISLIDKHSDDDSITMMSESLKVSTLFGKLLDPDDDISDFDLFGAGEEVGFHNDSPMSVAGLLERMIKMSHMTTNILESRDQIICLLLDITLVLLAGKKITSISDLEKIYQEELKKSKPYALYRYLINHKGLKNDNALALLFDLIINESGINSYVEESREAAILLALISVTDSKNWQGVLFEFDIVLKNKRADVLILKLFILLSNHCISNSGNIDCIAVSELFRFLIAFIPESIMQSQQRNKFLHQDLGAGSLAQCIFSIYKALTSLDSTEQTIAIFQDAVATLIGGSGANILTSSPAYGEIVTPQSTIQSPLVLSPVVSTAQLNQDRTPFIKQEPLQTVPPTVAPAKAGNIPTSSIFQTHVPAWLLKNSSAILPIFGAGVMFAVVAIFNPLNLKTTALNLVSPSILPHNSARALDPQKGAHFVSCKDFPGIGSSCLIRLTDDEFWKNNPFNSKQEFYAIIDRPEHKDLRVIIRTFIEANPTAEIFTADGLLLIGQKKDEVDKDAFNAEFARQVEGLAKDPKTNKTVEIYRTDPATKKRELLALPTVIFR